MNKHSMGAAHRPDKGKGKLKHVTIRPATHGGFISETHYEPQEKGNTMSDMMPMMETGVHPTLKSVNQHVNNVLSSDMNEPGHSTQPTSTPGPMDQE